MPSRVMSRRRNSWQSTSISHPLAAVHLEPIGAADAGAVEQCVDSHRCVGGCGGFEVELAEHGEFLPARQAGVDRQPSRPQAGYATFADTAKIARTAELDHGLGLAGAVDGVLQAQAGKAQVRGNPLRQVRIAEVELLAVEGDIAHPFRGDPVDFHRIALVPGGRNEGHLKQRIAGAPKAALGQEAEQPRLFVRQFLEKGRDFRRRPIGFAGALFGQRRNIAQLDSLRGRQPDAQHQ